ncbi:MAG TPA: dihydrolipoamide acetyltransferase family protein [Gaiellaceae bacterium]|nr:dihydrolipoamide acetyltransferase family protein [Gaiellaceae bacterium]
MAYEFKLPDLGEGLTEGEVARWLVVVGQEIAEDAPLVEIATDKTTVEIPSPAAGTVTQILVDEGAVVPVGTVLVVISPAEVAPAAHDLDREPAATRAHPAHVGTRAPDTRATPLVRRLAVELGVDLEQITGSGPQGRITEADVRGGGGDSEPAPAAERREPIRGIRRQMFEHLTRAHEIPAVTWIEEADFTDVDLKLLLPIVLKAVASALQEFPELNARIEGSDLVLLDRYDIGVAVQTDQGLVVPVVRACDVHSLEELDAEVRRLADAAQAGKLTPEELRGGTFTVTSAGRSAGILVTPLINHPEVAILGVHRIEDRAVVRDGEIVVRRMGNVSVTFDHRVVDGKRAADFGLAVIAKL